MSREVTIRNQNRFQEISSSPDNTRELTSRPDINLNFQSLYNKNDPNPNHYNSLLHALYGFILVVLIVLLCVSLYYFGVAWLDGDLCTNRIELMLSGFGYILSVYVIIKLGRHVFR